MSSVNPARSSSSRVVAAGFLVLALVALLWYAGQRRSVDPSPSAVGTSASSSASSASSASSRSSSSTPSRSGPTPDSGLPTVAAGDLPEVAREMLVTIHAGGPFRYREDGQTFANRERILPKEPSGYYREYTVKEGSQGDRGPLRIIGGRSGDLYWTPDHYAHFQQIKEGNP